MSTIEGQSAPAGGGGPTRRDVLKSVGVAGAALALPVTGTPVRAMGSGTGEYAPTVGPVDDPDLPGLHLEPVVGDCRDVFAHDSQCGTTLLYGKTPADELGTHTFEITFDGMSFWGFDENFGPGAWATRGGTRYERVPEPPANDPEWGPYEIVVYGSDLTFGADHDLLALDWYATCDVTPACRDRWCAIFEQTLTDLRNSVKDAQAAIDMANARLSGKLFRISVPNRTAEVGSIPALESMIEAEIYALANQINEDFKRLHQERLDTELANNDRTFVDEASLCEACKNCDPKYPSFDRVDAWELRVFEEGDATADWTSQGDPASGWARHGLRARVVLERVDPFADLLPELDGVLGAIFEVLLGILSFLAGLFGGGSGGQYLWTGSTYEASAWKDSGWQVTEGNGETMVSTTRARSDGSGTLDPEVDLSIDTRTNEYTLTFPTVDVAGVSTMTSGGAVGSSEYEGFVGFGDLIALKAAGGNVPGFDDVDDPNYDPTQFEDPKWPLEVNDDTCSLRIVKDLEVDLGGEGIDPTVMVFYNGPEGTAHLRWELTPLRLTPDPEERRVSCP